MSLAGGIEWLQLWERAVPWAPHRRRRELLASAGAQGGPPPAQLPVGRANALLLRLHVAMFGPRIDCGTTCPACAEALELEIDAGDLLGREPPPHTGPALLQDASWEVSFRLPTELDVEATRGERDPHVARSLLLQRCVSECRRATEPVDILLAPPEVTTRLGARMEELDPLAVIDFELRCGGCGHGWSSALEVDSILWARLDAWARRMLEEVHELARIYGWSERDIVSMSPWKRQIYLDLAAR
jgi:hypothetical protein